MPLPGMPWHWDNAKLLQHTHCALLEPVLDALTARDNETLIKCYQETSCSTTQVPLQSHTSKRVLGSPV